MLKVDLGRLEREWKVTLDEELAPDAPLWEGAEVQPRGPLQVRAEAQKAGMDVVVRGDFAGEVELPCRRCLTSVAVPVAEAFTLLYREGVDPLAAEDEGAYPLPARGLELDLTPAIREHVLLAVPRFALCDDACKGLCPHCGANRNETECDCREETTEERWSALRNLKLD